MLIGKYRDKCYVANVQLHKHSFQMGYVHEVVAIVTQACIVDISHCLSKVTTYKINIYIVNNLF